MTDTVSKNNVTTTENTILAEIVAELTPIGNGFGDDVLDLIIESVMLNHAVYSKASFLIATGRKISSEKDCAAIAKKEMALDKLNRDLQFYAKKGVASTTPSKD